MNEEYHPKSVMHVIMSHTAAATNDIFRSIVRRKIFSITFWPTDFLAVPLLVCQFRSISQPNAIQPAAIVDDATVQ